MSCRHGIKEPFAEPFGCLDCKTAARDQRPAGNWVERFRRALGSPVRPRAQRRTHGTHRFVMERSYAFEAAHRLELDPGENAKIHGHSWRVVVRVQSLGIVRLGRDSMTVMRQESLDQIVGPLAALLDHENINEALESDAARKPYWQHPTAEKVARWFASEVAVRLPPDVEIERVRVEKAGAAAEFLP